VSKDSTLSLETKISDSAKREPISKKFVMENFLGTTSWHSSGNTFKTTTTKQAGVLVGSALAGLFEMLLFGMKWHCANEIKTWLVKNL
jgi:hypothetical protein